MEQNEQREQNQIKKGFGESEIKKAENHLQQKVMDYFIGKVVRKDLAFLVKGGLPVPTYVLEYLLGQYCASDDEVVIAEGLEKVKSVIQNNYVHRAEAESVKGKIREAGKHRVIDKISVTLNEKADEYHATFANLALSGVPIGTEYVRKNPKLLSGNGVWCIVTIGYIPGEDVKVRWDIQQLKPIQISNIDLEEYIEQRQNFTTEECVGKSLSPWLVFSLMSKTTSTLLNLVRRAQVRVMYSRNYHLTAYWSVVVT